MAERVDLMQGGIKEAGQKTQNNDSKEQQEIKMIKGWYDEAKQHRAQYDKKWSKYYRAYYGKTWKDQKQTGTSTKPEINIVRPAIQTIVPIMTDAKPGFTVIPKTAKDMEFTEMLSESVDYLWQNQDMLVKMVEVITDMCIIDASILKVTWNSDLQDGLGDVDIEPIDLSKIWVNKECIDFDRKFKYSIEEVTKTVGEWKTIFPKHADDIKPDSQVKDGGNNKEIRGSYNDGENTLVSPVDQDRNKDADPMKGQSNLHDNQVATGWEVWYVDDAIDEYIENDEDGEERKVLKKRFPNGHLTTLLPHQQLILQSTQNPYNGDRQNPYVRFIDTVVPRQFYGQGEAEVLLDTQNMLNRTARVITEYLRLMSNPVWILDKNSGVNTQALTNKISLIIKKEPGTDVKRDFPDSIPPYVFEWFNTLLRLGDTQSGVQDVTQGRKPVGITAAEAIETLQEAAQTRIRLKDRNMENSLNQLGKLITNMMLQYYRGVRYQRVAGKSEDKPDFIEYTIEPVDAEGNAIDTADNAQGYQMIKTVTAWNPETEEYVEMPQQRAMTNKTTFDFKISSGTSLPFQKAQRGQRALQLFDRGAIDRQELLESFEWAKAEEVLQRIEKQEQAIAQQQAMAQQQGVVQ